MEWNENRLRYIPETRSHLPDNVRLPSGNRQYCSARDATCLINALGDFILLMSSLRDIAPLEIRRDERDAESGFRMRLWQEDAAVCIAGNDSREICWGGWSTSPVGPRMTPGGAVLQQGDQETNSRMN